MSKRSRIRSLDCTSGGHPGSFASRLPGALEWVAYELADRSLDLEALLQRLRCGRSALVFANFAHARIACPLPSTGVTELLHDDVLGHCPGESLHVYTVGHPRAGAGLIQDLMGRDAATIVFCSEQADDFVLKHKSVCGWLVRPSVLLFLLEHGLSENVKALFHGISALLVFSSSRGHYWVICRRDSAASVEAALTGAAVSRIWFCAK